MIASDKRQKAVELIIEANQNGARFVKACEILGISTSTFRRWRAGNVEDKRKGAQKHIPRRLTESEEQEIIAICCSEEYRDKNMYKIHASLLDKGIYKASVRTFYRIMKKNGLTNNRTNTKPARKKIKPPTKTAKKSNQIWCWDITWLPQNVRGFFYYAYVIIDIWDRRIVKWAIHDRENADLSKELFEKALRDNNYPNVWVHSDNGSPMKGCSLLALFYELGIKNSFSRPRVSNDNPYIESWFKTLKYDIKYPGKFDDIETAREWFAKFVDIYNTKHQHSGLYHLTPQQLRKGEYPKIASKRNKTMQEARSKNPQRWSSHVKQWPKQHIVHLNAHANTKIHVKSTKKMKLIS